MKYLIQIIALSFVACMFEEESYKHSDAGDTTEDIQQDAADAGQYEDKTLCRELCIIAQSVADNCGTEFDAEKCAETVPYETCLNTQAHFDYWFEMINRCSYWK